jgi:hypothetical protein
MGGFLATPIARVIPSDTGVDCYCSARKRVTHSANIVGLSPQLPEAQPSRGGCINENEPATCSNAIRQCIWIPSTYDYTAPANGVYIRTASSPGNNSGPQGCRNVPNGTVDGGLGVMVPCGLGSSAKSYIYTTHANCVADNPPTGAGSIRWVKFDLKCASCDN